MLGISKEQLAGLPEVHFHGKVVMVDSAAKARDALAYLNKLTQIGFDTETRPSFRKDQHYKVSLVQLSTNEECFLFRLKQMGSLKGLAELFENPAIQKIGLSIKDDFHSLQRLPDFKEFKPEGFVELQTYVKRFRIADNSLQKIYGVVFNEKISKSQRLTNWEAASLTPSQQSYAALDAWACLKLYNHLEAGGFDPEGCPYTIDDETAAALQRSVGIHIEVNDDGTVTVAENPKTEKPPRQRRRRQAANAEEEAANAEPAKKKRVRKPRAAKPAEAKKATEKKAAPKKTASKKAATKKADAAPTDAPKKTAKPRTRKTAAPKPADGKRKDSAE